MTKPKSLIVINPNSSQTVTEAIDLAINPLRRFGTPIRCLTLAGGPRGIESQKQADLTIAPMLDLAAAQTDAAGYVIACFGDPGLYALRDQTPLPVVGIQQAAVMTALTLGQPFGLIAILPNSIPRHMRTLGAMGVFERLAGDRALGLTVADLADESRTLPAMIATGCKLRDRDGANVLIMGCAGMARYREALETATGLPVIEPCQAAVSMALCHIELELSHKAKDAKNTW